MECFCFQINNSATNRCTVVFQALVGLEHEQQTYNHREEGSTFNESGSKNHVRADIAGNLRLTSDRFQCATADTADTYTSTQCSNTCTQGGNTSTCTDVEKNCVKHDTCYLRLN